MPSITSWTRLEPAVKTPDMKSALQARIYDPLWMLARQWQLGEFKGEDNGSPIQAKLRGTNAQLTRYLPGELLTTPTQGQKFDPRQQPLETLVERERIRPVQSEPEQPARLVQRAEAGLHFLRLLRREVGDKYRAFFIGRYPLRQPEQAATADQDSLHFLQMMVNRVPDGKQLWQAVRDESLAKAPELSPDNATIKKVGEAWAAWYKSLYSEPTEEKSAWLPDRMEYTFSVAAPSRTVEQKETVLTAREYYEGKLDWYSFDVNPNASLGATADTQPGANLSIVQTLIPAPVTFRGMPAQRFWEFEDATVDLGAIETAPQDVARMLLIEFALTYGNDWFIIPVDLPVGSLFQVSSLVITDTFGERILIPSATSTTAGQPKSSWQMYRQSSLPPTTGAAADFFFLAPTLVKTIEGQPLEEILFARDEMANLAWGIERVVEGMAGFPVNQREAYVAREQQARQQTVAATTTSVSDPATETLVYRLATTVPDYWIPFLPVQTDAVTGAIRLRRGGILSPDGTNIIRISHSRLLEGVKDVPEEEIPREGIRVGRNFQLARWLDGSTHLWCGRYKETGRGETSSGLRFDLGQPPDSQ